ncbi:unnamed protein product [Chironomus riparius]|uniref:Lipocalin/cytosolic fatty-acid binding domain-containing protein n=1 Tax=Chironomus riparius TaxID=315576 RepID=A0A9N9RSS6_9DIPT|nr:unnamed protein product [Chironomus riparius]
MVILLQFLTFSYLVCSSFAQISIQGGCPSFDCCKEEFTPLPVEDMTGIWYLYGGVPFFFDVNTKCTKVNVSSLSSNYFYMLTTQIETSSGEIRITDGFGNFTINGEVTTLVSDLRVPIPYVIIKDTPEYIIMFACLECGFFSTEGAGLYIYLYTKEELPPLTLVNEINEKLEQCGVPLDIIQRQDQITCALSV